jgi:hypothetical protein
MPLKKMELRFLGRLARGVVTILVEIMVLKMQLPSGAARNFELNCTERRKCISAIFMAGCGLP